MTLGSEAYFGGDAKASRFWRAYFKSADQCEFSDFVEAYERTSGRSVTAGSRLALRRHLDYYKESTVKIEVFKDFLSRCGPFAKCAVNCLTSKPNPPKRKTKEEKAEEQAAAAADKVSGAEDYSTAPAPTSPTAAMWQGDDDDLQSVASSGECRV